MYLPRVETCRSLSLASQFVRDRRRPPRTFPELVLFPPNIIQIIHSIVRACISHQRNKRFRSLRGLLKHLYIAFQSPAAAKDQSLSLVVSEEERGRYDETNVPGETGGMCGRRRRSRPP
jgi:hypothetical protein